VNKLVGEADLFFILQVLCWPEEEHASGFISVQMRYSQALLLLLLLLLSYIIISVARQERCFLRRPSAFLSVYL